MNIKEAQELIKNQEQFNSPAALIVTTKGMYAQKHFIPVALINSEVGVYNQRTYKMTFKNQNRFVAHQLFIKFDGTTTISSETTVVAIANVNASGTISSRLARKVGA